MALGAKEQQLKVYRICKKGVIDEEVFIGTMEESLRKGRLRKFSTLDDVDNYSTSCHMNIPIVKKYYNTLYVIPLKQ